MFFWDGADAGEAGNGAHGRDGRGGAGSGCTVMGSGVWCQSAGVQQPKTGTSDHCIH